MFSVTENGLGKLEFDGLNEFELVDLGDGIFVSGGYLKI